MFCVCCGVGSSVACLMWRRRQSVIKSSPTVAAVSGLLSGRCAGLRRRLGVVEYLLRVCAGEGSSEPCFYHPGDDSDRR